MTEETGKPATTAPLHHADWLCHDCYTCGTVAAEKKSELPDAVATAHAEKSPDCGSKYIATLPHVHPH